MAHETFGTLDSLPSCCFAGPGCESLLRTILRPKRESLLRTILRPKQLQGEKEGSEVRKRGSKVEKAADADSGPEKRVFWQMQVLVTQRCKYQCFRSKLGFGGNKKYIYIYSHSIYVYMFVIYIYI